MFEVGGEKSVCVSRGGGLLIFVVGGRGGGGGGSNSTENKVSSQNYNLHCRQRKSEAHGI